jgi:hypothetical protein
MEEKLTADLTETEREHLMKALAKIHRSATDLLGRPSATMSRPSLGPKNSELPGAGPGEAATAPSKAGQLAPPCSAPATGRF